MNEQLFSEIKEMMIEELGVDENLINPDAALSADLNINSLEMLNVITATEEKYDISLEEDRLHLIQTVGDYVYYVNETIG